METMSMETAEKPNSNTVFVNFSFDDQSKWFPPGTWIEVHISEPPPGIAKATLGIVGALEKEFMTRPVGEWPQIAYTALKRPDAPCEVSRHRLEYPGTM